MPGQTCALLAAALACTAVSVGIAWNATNFAEAGALSQAKQDYSFSQWGGSTATNYTSPVTNWAPDFGSLPVENVHTGTVSTWTNDAQEVGRSRSFVLSPDLSGSEWGLYVQEFPSVTAAHEMMLVRFSCRSFGAPEAGSAQTVEAGDQCYVFEKGDSHRTVYFCRNNVFVEVAAGATNYATCTGLVDAIDQQIMDASVAQ